MKKPLLQSGEKMRVRVLVFSVTSTHVITEKCLQYIRLIHIHTYTHIHIHSLNIEVV